MKIFRFEADTGTQFSLTFLTCLYVNWHLVTPTTSFQNVSRVSNISDKHSSQTAGVVPVSKRDDYAWSKRSQDKLQLNHSTSINSLHKVITSDKHISMSTYQSKLALIKQNSEKADSQDAPEDATSGHMTMHPSGKPKKLIFCYYGSSANSRPGIGKFWPEHIDPFLCTHLVFAFVDITEDGTGLRPNNWNDLGEKGLYVRTLKLKERNPDLKILLAVGGWKIGSKPFLPVIQNEEIWKTWVSNVIVYLRKFNFDGFDMDWEFPTWRGSGPEDKYKFTLLMKDLYEAFAEEAKSSGKEKLILTLAAAASAFYAEKAYEKSEIHKYIDYMLLMTYNYHGSGWEKHTGHHSPLLPHSLDPEGEQRELYMLWSVKYWLNFGVPREKIILGLATYGLGWKLTDISQTGVRAPANGGTSKGKYTEESGILSHYEICDYVLNDGWKVQWIDEQKVPYAYGGGEWVGFDSPDSFYLKETGIERSSSDYNFEVTPLNDFVILDSTKLRIAATIIEEGLSGAFVWSVEMDDFNGHCGGPKYPLLRTIYEVFTQSPSMSNLDSLKSALTDNKKGSSEHNQHSSAAAGSSHHHNRESDQSSSSSAHDRHHTDTGTGSGYSSSCYIYDDAGDAGDNDDADQGEAFDCNSVGLGIHSDPTSCLRFIVCMPATPHEMRYARMSCPEGTMFNRKLKVCDHYYNVKCQL